MVLRMFQPRHFIRYCIPVVMAAMCSFFALSPNVGYAQDSITELERNVNASGKERTSKDLRVLSELGMGVLGAGTAFGVSLVTAVFTFNNRIAADIAFHLALPPLTAGGVYLGGWLTGGRSETWAPFAGAYAGWAAGAIVFFSLWGYEGFGKPSTGAEIIDAFLVPALTLVGAVVGYELSEKKKTNDLKAQRDRLTQGTSAPIMIQLYSGTF